MHFNDSSYHLFSKNNIYIDKIINCSKKKLSDLEKKFIKLFYWHVAMLNITEKEIMHFNYFAEKSFEFISLLKNNETKLNIYSPDFLEYNHKFSVVELICKDTPFKVDSIVSSLNKAGIKIYRIIYPIINVKRDENGNLLELYESEQEGSAKETIIHIHVQYLESEQVIDSIKSNIYKIIEKVDLAVLDWREMQASVRNYNQLIQDQHSQDDSFKEKMEFLLSLESKYFVFAGSVKYNFKKESKNYSATLDKKSKLGILKEDSKLLEMIEKAIFNEEKLSGPQQLINIGKLNQASVIHRDANFDYVCIKIFNNKGEVIEAAVYVGLFTSILYYQSATLIPLIRGKVAQILQKAGYSTSSHGGKEIVSIIESLPRDELFQIEVDELFKIVMEVSALMYFPDLRFFVRSDKGEKFISCLVFIPHERIKAELADQINSVIKREFGDIITNNYVHINNSQMCYFHIIANLKENLPQTFNCADIEKELNEVTFLWKEDLRQVLFSEHGISGGDIYYQEYQNAFPESYKEKYKPKDETIEDILYLEKVKNDKEVIFSILDTCPGDLCSIRLKIYSDFELPLSEVMPMIQDVGFSALAEHIFKIETNSKKTLWIHNFYLNTKECKLSSIKDVKKNVEDTLAATWSKKAISDDYNKLILSAGLVHREVSLLRAIGKYLYQIKFGYSKEYIGNVLTRNATISQHIVEAFKDKFNPNFSLAERVKKYNELKVKIDNLLSVVGDPLEDKVIRKFIEIIDAMVRTNYFCTDTDGSFKDYISFKIDSKQISNLPKPEPFMEIFVYSSKFEAIHLRSAKVSRGGLRWSDRSEDFRTEVLGLMKAQIPKNSVIVPGGSKGGFVVNHAHSMSKDEFYQTGVECYKNFLRGLLDITDNITNTGTIHPKNVVCWDNEDPYLVVAADKGTATFSDIANGISAEYNFWLGDAFASGGSAGYDHKKMAITAKGAWISVERHFFEMGKDISKNDFTVVGIGDMAGDVFGNGMLLSKNIQLVAAFNHLHIFIDPNPDSKKSFEERKRLFELKGSTWADYEKSIMSKGAAIYERKAKTIELTSEIQERFSIHEKHIAPDALISILLKAEVDLLWNGGIGTYVKSFTEDNQEVGDKANDNLRINGIDLRCKVVGEGGNLGFTQAGRIEYARNGGRINTDAIDNSAGVDCSDHEVNIKIILEKILKNSKIDIESRNKILSEMTDEVANLVLRDNRLQTTALSVTQYQGYDNLSAQTRHIELLEKEGRIDRKLLSLPSNEAIAQLSTLKQGLSRPEIAVLLANTKLSIFDSLLESELPDDEYFDTELERYFPSLMRSKFSEEIQQHPLRREIIATIITNSMLNRVSPHFVHLTCADTGYKVCDLAKAYPITKDLFGLSDLWSSIEKLNGKIDANLQIEMYIEIKKFVMRSSLWLIRNVSNKKIKAVISNYKTGITELSSFIEKYLIGPAKKQFEAKFEKFSSDKNIPDDLARAIALLRPLSASYNIINVSHSGKIPLEEATELYFSLGDYFNFEWLRISADKLPMDQPWQRLSVTAFKDELYDVQKSLASTIINYCAQNKATIDDWYKANVKEITQYSQYMEQVQEYEHTEYAMLDLVLKKIKSISARH